MTSGPSRREADRGRVENARRPSSGLAGFPAQAPRHLAVLPSSGSGATRTPKGLTTPTCFRDRLLIQPGHFHGRKGWDSHPHGRLTHTRVAGGLLIWPDPFQVLEPSVGVAPTASSLPRTRSGLLSYKGLASPARLER